MWKGAKPNHEVTWWTSGLGHLFALLSLKQRDAVASSLSFLMFDELGNILAQYETNPHRAKLLVLNGGMCSTALLVRLCFHLIEMSLKERMNCMALSLHRGQGSV